MSRGGLNRHGVETGYRHHDIASGVISDLSGMVVGTPVMVGRNTSLVLNATIAGSVTWVFPMKDPAGTIVTGFPFSAPEGFIEAATPPAAFSRVGLLMGILDGSDITTDQWTGGGLYYGAAGTFGRVVSHNIAAADTAAPVAGALFAEVNPCARSSAITVGAMGERRTIVKASPTRDGGDGASIQGAPNDEYAKQPRMFFAITSDGTSMDTAMPIVVGWRYLAPFAQMVLGG